MDKIGFILCLFGAGGMAEAYGFNRSFVISLLMLIIGGLLIAKGEKREEKDYKRSNSDPNRLYYLP